MEDNQSSNQNSSSSPQRGGAGNNSETRWIKQVWADNLEEEILAISEMVVDQGYRLVAIDTEFPGVVARPLGTFRNAQNYHYRTLKCNVDLMKIIQLGLCFYNEDGKEKEGCCVWQFNFKFNLKEDVYAQDSIELLQRAGLEFDKFNQRGIDVKVFGELIMTSGLVLNDEVTWVCFHGSYDFAYLAKILMPLPLPDTEKAFYDLVRDFFPILYDVKKMLSHKRCGNLHGGLSDIAAGLNLDRKGDAHQAGSDSYLTGKLFNAIKDKYFSSDKPEDAQLLRQLRNKLYGIKTV